MLRSNTHCGGGSVEVDFAVDVPIYSLIMPISLIKVCRISPSSARARGRRRGRIPAAL